MKKEYKVSIRKDQRGLSLVELMVTIAVLAIALTGILQFMTTISRYYSKQNQSINVHNELQTTFNFIGDKIRSATKVETFSGAIVITSTDDSGATIQETIRKDGNKLYYYANGSSDKELLTEYVTDFKVTPKSGYTILYMKLKDMSTEEQMEQNIFMRNAKQEETTTK